MFNWFTDDARQAFDLASQEALRLNSDYLGTEHLLLGLLEQLATSNKRLFNCFGIELADVKRAVTKLPKSDDQNVDLLLTPMVKSAIQYAIEEAGKLNSQHVGIEHLILSLLRDPDGDARFILATLGFDFEAAHQDLKLALLSTSCGSAAATQLKNDENDQLQTDARFQAMRCDLEKEYRARLTIRVGGLAHLAEPYPLAVSYHITFKDILNSYKIYFPAFIKGNPKIVRSLLFPGIIWALCLSGAIRSYWHGLPLRSDFLALLFLFCIGPVYIAVNLWHQRRKFDKLVNLKLDESHVGKFTLSIGDKGISIQKGHSATTYDWESIKRVRIMDNYLFLYFEVGGLMIPRVAFGSESGFINWLQQLGLYSGHAIPCPRCKYNIVGSTSGRCPECGYPA